MTTASDDADNCLTRLVRELIEQKSIARELIGDLDPGMLLIADRGFYGYDLWKLFRQSGAELLCGCDSESRCPFTAGCPTGPTCRTLSPFVLWAYSCLPASACRH